MKKNQGFEGALLVSIPLLPAGDRRPQFRIFIYAEPGIATAEADPAELRCAFVDQVRPEDLVVIVGAEGLNAKTI